MYMYLYRYLTYDLATHSLITETLIQDYFRYCRSTLTHSFICSFKKKYLRGSPTLTQIFKIKSEISTYMMSHRKSFNILNLTTHSHAHSNNNAYLRDYALEHTGTVLERVREKERIVKGMSTGEVAGKRVKVITQEKRVALIDISKKREYKVDEAEADIGTPFAMVSHAWGSPFLDTLTCVEEYIKHKCSHDKSNESFKNLLAFRHLHHKPTQDGGWEGRCIYNELVHYSLHDGESRI